ncbi:lysine--tRNA ligase [Candidatus Mycoplasma haematominutum]|uniref:Lysine--tRNA ligase n=1 Tax=Candidatus Mycoplasma haematominutum 'Birmingham 1' TaxID=1116213 RepID=G8C2X8_9MOLU|nr:lysine--tRNA ligase [Candidatus Mycoplasma haematominutum]CCE66676.1 lysyl-tRNA synthetase [Candidatus Mycoplasma haematominutum 'Birmingham 1']
MIRKLNDQEIVRRKKLEDLRQSSNCPFLVESILTNYSLEKILSLDESYSSEISCGGRILFIRQTFFVLSENNFRLQLYIDIKEERGKILYNYFKRYLDIGDYLWVKGTIFKTKTGMLTLRLSDLKLVSKALKPLPEKRLGITNDELMVRNRVGALITNPTLFSTLQKRAEIIFALRTHLNNLGYTEFETPILHKIAGGALAKPFKTYHNSLKEDLFLRVAPELYLKRLITAGFTKVYEIGRSFRNEGVDNFHNPEFSSIEIYTAYFGLQETMNLTEELICHLYEKFHADSAPKTLSFRRVAIWELLEQKIGVNFYSKQVLLEEALSIAEKYGIQLREDEKIVAEIYEKLFEELISPNLQEPTFVFGFSSELSPLAKKDPKNNFFALRFELYINGREIANGFAEQNDSEVQEAQFKKQLMHDVGEKTIDYDYLSCLEYGLPPTGGVGIGIDRLVMFLLQQNSIKDVIPFPFLKG